MRQALIGPAAVALARSGCGQAAVELAESVISEAERDGVRGVPLGELHEGRARIAICMLDSDAFEKALALLEPIFLRHDNPALTVRVRRLREAAAAARIARTASARPLASGLTADEIREQLSKGSRQERLQASLRILVDCCNAIAGCLLDVRSEELRVLAETGDMVLSEETKSTARLVADVQAVRTATITTTLVTRLSNSTGLDGCQCHTLPLIRVNDAGDPFVAAVAVLRAAEGTFQVPGTELTTVLADELAKSKGSRLSSAPRTSALGCRDPVGQ